MTVSDGCESPNSALDKAICDLFDPTDLADTSVFSGKKKRRWRKTKSESSSQPTQPPSALAAAARPLMMGAAASLITSVLQEEAAAAAAAAAAQPAFGELISEKLMIAPIIPRLLSRTTGMREDEYCNLIGFEHSAENTLQQLEDHFRQLCEGGGEGTKKRSVMSHCKCSRI